MLCASALGHNTSDMNEIEVKEEKPLELKAAQADRSDLRVSAAMDIVAALKQEHVEAHAGKQATGEYTL